MKNVETTLLSIAYEEHGPATAGQSSSRTAFPTTCMDTTR
jgi:hypothetical protein